MEKENFSGVYLPVIGITVIVLIGIWYWYEKYSRYISSDDAHLEADDVS